MSAGAALAGFVFTPEGSTRKKQKPACAAEGKDKKHDMKTGRKGWPRGGLTHQRIESSIKSSTLIRCKT